MKASGGILRGHLRPMGARSPPFVVIGLLVILGVLGFNYWNLTYEYDAIVKEISDLQDHLRIALLKKESADKQSDALEKRFREAEQQLGKVKITSNQSQRDLADLNRNLETKNGELLAAQSQLDTCQALNRKLDSNKETVADLQKKIDQLEVDKSNLSKGNSLLISEKADLSLKVEEVEKNLAILGAMRNEQDPFEKIHQARVSEMINGTKSANLHSEDSGQKQNEFNVERNGLKAPISKSSTTNETKNSTKSENEVEKVSDREDGELMVARNSDFEIITGKAFEEGNGIEDETKPIRPELNSNANANATATAEEELKSVKSQMPNSNDAQQVVKPVNLSERSVKADDWRDNAV